MTTTDTTWTVVGIITHHAPIATCQHCPRTGLRRLIRITDGTHTMDVGDTCAARLTGQPVRTVRARASAADRAREAAVDAAWVAWNTGLQWALNRAADPFQPHTGTVDEADAAYRAEHPEPQRPARLTNHR